MTMGGGIRGLASGTAIYGVGEVLSRAVGFLLLPLLTAYLTPADFGISSMLAALTFLLTPLFSLGMGAAIAPAYFHRPDTGHKAAVIGTTVAILSASVVVMLVAGVATAPLMSDLSFQTGAYARLVVLAVLGAAFTILTIPFRQYFQFEQRVRAYVALSTCSALVTAAVTVWAVVGLGRGILGFIEATVIGQAFTFAIFLTIASRRVNLSVDWAIGRDLLRLGLPMIPAFGSIFFMQHGSKYLLQRLGSLDDVGIYTIGLNVGLVISVLVTGFQSAWVPYFMSFADRQDEARIQLGRVATYYVFSFGAVSLVLFAVARLVVLLMTQPEFHPAWRVVGLSAAAQFLSGFFIVLLPGMYYAREVKYIALIQGAAALIGLLIGVGMILSFGVFGAALGLTLSYVGLVVLQYGFNRLRHYVDVKYEWRRLLLFALIYTVFASVMLVDRASSLGEESIMAFAATACVPLIIALQMTHDELRSLRSVARRLSALFTGPDAQPVKEAAAHE